MKKLIYILVLSSSLSLASQEVEVIKFSDLQTKMLYTESPLTVFNFWATWCGPCIKELPHFDRLSEDNKNVKVYLVSIDFPNELERVKKFVKKKGLKSEVLFLNEKDPDNYMPKVSQDWTGAIPATLFVTEMGKTYFHEKAFTKEELLKAVNKYLN
ncbi:MAG: hypothetical protein Tsb0034_27360 [Ekhidna sp.]